jgi:hypothetical protein
MQARLQRAEQGRIVEQAMQRLVEDRYRVANVSPEQIESFGSGEPPEDIAQAFTD